LWSSGLFGSCLRALYNHPILAGMMGFGIDLVWFGSRFYEYEYEYEYEMRASGSVQGEYHTYLSICVGYRVDILLPTLE